MGVQLVKLLDAVTITGPAGQGVPVGGTTGQVLAKKTNADYDTQWVAPGGGGGGQVNSVVAGTLISVDSTDPVNPIVSFSGTIPTKTSDLTNDSGFLSALPYHNHQCGIDGQPTITEGTAGNAGKVQVDTGNVWFFTDATMDVMAYHTIAASGYLTPTDDVTGYVCADRDTDTWVILTLDQIDYLRYVPYFIVFKRSGSTNLHHQKIEIEAHDEVENHHSRVLRTTKYDREPGALENIAVDASLNITISGGGVWSVNHRYQIVDVTTATRQFQCYQTSGVWTISTNTAPVINNLQYNQVSVGLTTLTDTYWTINYIWRGIEDQDHLYTVLGTSEYATSALAQADNTIPIAPDLINSHTMFVGRVIVQKSATSNYIIESAFKTVFAASSAVTVHNSLTGRSAADTHPASSITNTPAGNIAATDVQSALNELDAEKVPLTKVSVSTAMMTELATGFTLAGGTTSKTLTVPDTASVSGNNTGDQDLSVLVPKAGTTMTGELIAQNNTDYTVAQMRNITLSTTTPSGGGNGDIWIQYVP